MRTERAALAGAVVMMAAIAMMSLGCSKKAEPNPASDSTHHDLFSIYTVNYPLSYFAERMAPTDARVVLPVLPGTDPAFWKPSADVVREYQAASLILLNGAGYAGWTRYATLPQATMVVTADGCRDAYLRTQQGVQHQHGPEGTHAHAELAFTTWLDLRLAACQSGRIRDALIERMPTAKDDISAEFKALERDLLDLDERLRAVGKAVGEQPLLASHPVYQYLADAYGLSIQSLHLEPDQALSDDDWKEVDAVLKQHRAKWMLWEAPPLEATEAGLLERGVTVIVFDPAGQSPSGGDFLSVMKDNVARLECVAGVKPCR
ncbi:MAG: metal ABC transporter substrate-binding protein [Deltaproteobacteria bacterium]|nr:metal ABC transporter substrate-binding protein [Deltaproteobacteria bacterium]